MHASTIWTSLDETMFGLPGYTEEAKIENKNLILKIFITSRIYFPFTEDTIFILCTEIIFITFLNTFRPYKLW